MPDIGALTAASGALAGLGKTTADVGFAVMKTIQDQKDLLEGMDLETQMRVEKQTFRDQYVRGLTGYEADPLSAYMAKDAEITEKYASKASNPAVAMYLKKVGAVTQRENGVHVGNESAKLLHLNTIQRIDAKVNEYTKNAMESGEWTPGLANITATVQTFRSYLGPLEADAMIVKKASDYTENFIKQRLYNPATVEAMLDRLDDPKQKKAFFAVLDSKKWDDMERIIEASRSRAETLSKKKAEKAFDDVHMGIIDLQLQADQDGSEAARDAAIVEIESRIRQAVTDRTILAKDADHLRKQLREWREGKFAATDATYTAEVWEGILSGRISRRQILADPRIAPDDKKDMMKTIYSIERSAAEQGRMFRRMEFNMMLESVKPHSDASPDLQAKYKMFAADATRAFSQGADPWEFYRSNYNKYTGAAPRISHPAIGAYNLTTFDAVTKAQTAVATAPGLTLEERNSLAVQISIARKRLVDIERAREGKKTEGKYERSKP
jgi:hypothetical protein